MPQHRAATQAGVSFAAYRVLFATRSATNRREHEWVQGLEPGERMLLVELLRTWLRFRPATRAAASAD
ncbi:hypothetical protein [Agromyces sp. NPDC049794]|uniref:hypothetical protein n=1 Tax=unclassified Agromyces TaxID=2639701 RepID=UPI0033F24275